MCSLRLGALGQKRRHRARYRRLVAIDQERFSLSPQNAYDLAQRKTSTQDSHRQRSDVDPSETDIRPPELLLRKNGAALL